MDKTKYIKANSVAFSGHRTIAEDRKGARPLLGYS